MISSEPERLINSLLLTQMLAAALIIARAVLRLVSCSICTFEKLAVRQGGEGRSIRKREAIRKGIGKWMGTGIGKVEGEAIGSMGIRKRSRGRQGSTQYGLVGQTGVPDSARKASIDINATFCAVARQRYI